MTKLFKDMEYKTFFLFNDSYSISATVGHLKKSQTMQDFPFWRQWIAEYESYLPDTETATVLSEDMSKSG